MPNFHLHQIHLPQYHLDKDHDLWILYLVRVLANTAQALALFFLPLYIFEVGRSVAFFGMELSPFRQGLVAVVAYYLLTRLSSLLMTWVSVKSLTTQGIRFTLLVSQVLYLLQLVLLIQAERWSGLLWLAAVALGAHISFFWLANHLVLSRRTKKTHLGQDLGFVQFLLEFSRMIAPAVGGVIAVTFGFDVLFLIAFALIIGAVGLLLQMRPLRLAFQADHQTFAKILRQPAFLKQAISFCGRYINDGLIVLWPLYVYFLLGGIDKVGYLYSFSLLLALFMSLLVGFYIDHTKSRRSFWLTGGSLSLVWLGRLFAFTPYTVAVADAFDKLVSNAHWLLYDMLLYKTAKGKRDLLYLAAREVVISAFAVVFWLGVGVILISTAYSWQALFMIAAVGVLLSAFMSDRLS